MAKVAIESLWAVITYNLQQSIRLGLRQQFTLASETKMSDSVFVEQSGLKPLS